MRIGTPLTLSVFKRFFITHMTSPGFFFKKAQNERYWGSISTPMTSKMAGDNHYPFLAGFTKKSLSTGKHLLKPFLKPQVISEILKKFWSNLHSPSPEP